MVRVSSGDYFLSTSVDNLMEEYHKALQSISKMAEESEVHEVVPGDSLWVLQVKYKVPWEVIRDYNELKSDRLILGQKIKIPPKGSDYSGLPRLEGPFDLATEIQKAAVAQGVEPGLLAALVQVESMGNPQATSSAGAVGLTQLTPAVVQRLGGTPEDSMDPVWNLNAGAKWLKMAISEALSLKGVQDKSTQTTLTHALMIYHAGAPAVQKWIEQGGPPEGFGTVGPNTLSYPQKVLSLSVQKQK